ncbi:hypothetical protein MMC17_004531 [Xylographa soralifera]|nr:hypothetical protein [Xylographa soralifera]
MAGHLDARSGNFRANGEKRRGTLANVTSTTKPMVAAAEMQHLDPPRNRSLRVEIDDRAFHRAFSLSPGSETGVIPGMRVDRVRGCGPVAGGDDCSRRRPNWGSLFHQNVARPQSSDTTESIDAARVHRPGR